MIETHIIMSLLIFCLILLLVLHLVSFMDLTIIHMVLIHERIALCLDALVTAHILIGSYTHFEPRHLDGSHFPRRGSRPTRSNGEVQKTMRTSLGHMVNPSTEPLIPSYHV
jgi:hypothetical protein